MSFYYLKGEVVWWQAHLSPMEKVSSHLPRQSYSTGREKNGIGEEPGYKHFASHCGKFSQQHFQRTESSSDYCLYGKLRFFCVSCNQSLQCRIRRRLSFQKEQCFCYGCSQFLCIEESYAFPLLSWNPVFEIFSSYLREEKLIYMRRLCFDFEIFWKNNHIQDKVAEKIYVHTVLPSGIQTITVF